MEQSDIITGYSNYIPAGGRKGAENTVNGANIFLYTVNTVLPLNKSDQEAEIHVPTKIYDITKPPPFKKIKIKTGPLCLTCRGRTATLAGTVVWSPPPGCHSPSAPVRC